MAQIECPRCGAKVGLVEEPERRRAEREKVNHLRASMGQELLPDPQIIRAHRDPSDARSCWAGGKSVTEIIDRIQVHRTRLREAEDRAREGAAYRALHGDDAIIPE